LSAGALVVLGLGIGLATYKSDRIARAVRSLIAPALALGRGEAPSIQWTEMREANEVAKALAKAFELLQHRTNERDRAERDKQVAESAAHLKSEFVATVVTRCARRSHRSPPRSASSPALHMARCPTRPGG
jgi:nitrogen fixation/metabolism regulation signal transduction histidine kinase